MTYAVVFTRGYSLPRDGDFVYCGSVTHAMSDKPWGATMRSHRVFRTLAEARKARMVTGDLVVDAKTLHISQSQAWLWPWERKDPNSYPRQMMRQEAFR